LTGAVEKGLENVAEQVNANCVAMIGRRSGDQASFFYQFRLDGDSIDPEPEINGISSRLDTILPLRTIV
jgi:hypothetical protein